MDYKFKVWIDDNYKDIIPFTRYSIANEIYEDYKRINEEKVVK